MIFHFGNVLFRTAVMCKTRRAEDKHYI